MVRRQVAGASLALAGVGVAELALSRRGSSMLDELSEVAIDRAPLPAVCCRAHDGTVQAGTGRPPYPHGADGFHRVKVAVRAG